MFSLESPHRSVSNEYNFQYKKENHPKLFEIYTYGSFSAMVNEPSVFKPLKVYCINDAPDAFL